MKEKVEKSKKQIIKLKISKYKNMKQRLEHHYFEEETISIEEYWHDQNIYDNIINDLYDIINN